MALDEFEARRLARRWRVVRCGLGVRAHRLPEAGAAARVRTGAALRLLPGAAPPARAGRLTPQHVTVLADCVRRHPDLAARDERLLVEQAETLTLTPSRSPPTSGSSSPWPSTARSAGDSASLSRSTRSTCPGRWTAAIGSRRSFHRAGPLVDAHSSRGRPPSQSRSGWRSVLTTVASQVRPPPSSTSSRRACAANPPRHPCPTGIGRRYHPRRPDRSAADLRLRLLAFRVVLGAHSEVLDVVRSPRSAAGIRRAITHRDGGCTFPSCDRQPSWCDIHHCRYWEHGGPTNIDNGALLCRRHHTFIHRWVAQSPSRMGARRYENRRQPLRHQPLGRGPHRLPNAPKCGPITTLAAQRGRPFAPLP